MNENEKEKKKKRERIEGIIAASALVVVAGLFAFAQFRGEHKTKELKKQDPESQYYYGKDTLEGKIERTAALNRSKLVFDVSWKGKIEPIQIEKRVGDRYIYFRFLTVNLFDTIEDTGKKEIDRIMWTIDLMKMKWLKTVYVDPYIYGKMNGEYRYLCPIGWKFTKNSDGKYRGKLRRYSYYYGGEFHRIR